MLRPTSPSSPVTTSPTRPLPPPLVEGWSQPSRSMPPPIITSGWSSSSSSSSSSAPSSARVKNDIFQVFRLESPRDHHNIFVQTDRVIPTGVALHITSSEMVYAETEISHLSEVAEVYDTMLLGTILPEDMDRLRELCRANLPPAQRGTGEERYDERLRRCRGWVRETVYILTDAGILEPVTPMSSGNFLPRHHHTQHCQHQRRYIHHPYRRRRNLIQLNGQPMNPAMTIQRRD